MDKAQLFFSYSRVNSDFVLKLATDLRKAGLNLWLDQLDIEPGDHWDESINEALNNCDTLLVILSSASVSSENVMDEVAFALEKGKQVVPILLEDCSVPFRLRRLQYVDFKYDYDKGFTRLENSLRIDRVSEREKEAEIPNRAQRRNHKLTDTPPFEGTQSGPAPQLASHANKTLLSSGLKYPIGILAGIALIGLLGITANIIGLIGQSSDAKLIAIGTGPYHLGDESISGWPEVTSNCFEADFTTELPVKKLALKAVFTQTSLVCTVVSKLENPLNTNTWTC